MYTKYSYLQAKISLINGDIERAKVEVKSALFYINVVLVSCAILTLVLTVSSAAFSAIGN